MKTDASGGRVSEAKPHPTAQKTAKTAPSGGKKRPRKTGKDARKSGVDRATALAERRRAAQLDEVEKFLAKMDNPDEWRTLRNSDGSEKLVLTDGELSLIARLYNNQLGTADYNPFEPAVDFFSQDVMPMALPAGTEPKRRFIPSLHEAKEIMRLVKAMRAGKRRLPGYKPPAKPRVYDIWGADDSTSPSARMARHIAAPRVKLPGHAESYNPPREYLFDETEEAEWRKRQANPDPDESLNPDDFLPQRYAAMRLVPGYARSVQECFVRCLDLYLCPRAIRNRVNVEPDALLAELPDPRDLRPFPTAKAINYRTAASTPVTGLSFDASGGFFVSGQGATVTLWETQSGRGLYTWTFAHAVTSVAWNPARNTPIIAVTHGSEATLVVPPIASFPGRQAAVELLAHGKGAMDCGDNWTLRNECELVVSLAGLAKQVTWHRKGDYFATVVQPPSTESPARAVTVHNLSRHASQQPFRRLPSVPVHVAFHPLRPLIMLVSPAGAVRIYNLQSGALEKKLQGDSSTLTPTLAIHPSGDHVLMAGTDGRVTWFDLDLTARPYQTLNGHQMATRSVAFHARLPLFASASADGTLHIAHGQVFQDFTQNPLIVPVKIIGGHSNQPEGGNKTPLTHCLFHPTQPWILTATTDGSLSLFTA